MEIDVPQGVSDDFTPHPNPPPLGGRERHEAREPVSLPPRGGGLGWGAIRQQESCSRQRTVEREDPHEDSP